LIAIASGGLQWQYIATIATFSSFILFHFVLFYCKWVSAFTVIVGHAVVGVRVGELLTTLSA